MQLHAAKIFKKCLSACLLSLLYIATLYQSTMGLTDGIPVVAIANNTEGIPPVTNYTEG